MSHMISLKDPNVDFQWNRDGTFTVVGASERSFRFRPTESQMRKITGGGGTIKIQDRQIVGSYLRLVKENPMRTLSKNEKYAAYAAVGGAILLGGALIYHYSKAPSTTGSTGSTSASWKRIPTGGMVNSGDHVRVSITELDFQQFAATLGLPNTLAGFGQYITALHVAPSVKIYGGPISSNPPPPSRPADWPADDTDVAIEYSADFTYSGPISYPVVNGINTWVLK